MHINATPFKHYGIVAKLYDKFPLRILQKDVNSTKTLYIVPHNNCSEPSLQDIH